MRGIWGVVLVLSVVVAPVGAAQPDGYDCPVDTEDVEEPGEELANVVGAQESIVARELERRGFNATLANASSPEERATVIATELDRIDVRLTALETCQDALIEAREDGNLTDQQYRQRIATLDADVVEVNERLDRAEVAATDLSPEVRADNDVDRNRFTELGERVADLQTFVAQPIQSVESMDGEETDIGPPALTATDPTDEESPSPVATTTEDETDDEQTPGDGPDTETPEPTETEQPDDREENGQDGEDGNEGNGDGGDEGNDSNGEDEGDGETKGNGPGTDGF